MFFNKVLISLRRGNWLRERVLAPLALSAFLALPTQAETLQATVREDHVLPPTLQAGQIYNRANLPQTRIVDWYRIPQWLAGVCQRDKIEYGYEGMDNRRQRVRGKQMAADGSVWDARVEPIVYDISQDDGFEQTVQHVVMSKEEPLEIDNSHASFRCAGIFIICNARTGKIKRITSSEQTQTFKPIGPRSNVCDITNGCEFDSFGVRIKSQNPNSQEWYVEKKMRPFRPLNRDGELDFKRSFVEFLKATGQADLIPAN